MATGILMSIFGKPKVKIRNKESEIKTLGVISLKKDLLKFQRFWID